MHPSALGESRPSDPLRPAHDRDLGILLWDPRRKSHNRPYPLQLPGPMWSRGSYETGCGWLGPPWAFIPQPSQPLEPTQPSCLQAAPPMIHESLRPKHWLGRHFPLRLGEAPTPSVSRSSRGHESSDWPSLCKADPGELEVRVGFSPPHLLLLLTGWLHCRELSFSRQNAGSAGT